MPRRASSSAHPLWLALAAALALAALGGGWWLSGRGGDPFRTTTALPVADYLEHSNSLRGNVYKVEGTVTRALEWSAASGRLFAVETPAGEMLGVLVPTQFNHVNMERGQRFLFKLEVGEKGILRAQEVRKA